MVTLRAAVDSSFLYNVWQLKILSKLCVIFEKIYLVPSVIAECQRFRDELADLTCSEEVILSAEEREKAAELHQEFIGSFPGQHHGEIECLVVAQSRAVPLVISDNFAPWFLQKQHSEYRGVTIHRGWWVIGRLIETKALTVEFLTELNGRYPQKALKTLWRLFQSEKR